MEVKNTDREKVLTFIENLRREGKTTFCTPYHLGTPATIVSILDDFERQGKIVQKYALDNFTLQDNIYYEII